MSCTVDFLRKRLRTLVRLKYLLYIHIYIHVHTTFRKSGISPIVYTMRRGVMMVEYTQSLIQTPSPSGANQNVPTVRISAHADSIVLSPLPTRRDTP